MECRDKSQHSKRAVTVHLQLSLRFEKIDGFTEYVIPELRTVGTVELRIE